jgi:hypothetical protein
MKYDPHTGDRLVRLRQLHRHVVRQEKRWAGDVHEAWWVDIESGTRVGRADFQQLDRMELQVRTASA